MITCPQGHVSFDETAAFCPRCGTAIPRPPSPLQWSAEPPVAAAGRRGLSRRQLIALLTTFGGVILLLVVFLPTGEESDEITSIDAQAACEEFILDRLKSPSSADFGSATSSRATTAAGEVFVVTGAVDADNAFGASIRNRYVCEVVYSDGRWRLHDLDMS